MAVAGVGEVSEEEVPQEVASEAVAAEAGDTEGKNFILDLSPCPFSLTAAHPLKGLCALFRVIKRTAFRTSNPGIFRRSCTAEEEKR